MLLFTDLIFNTIINNQVNVLMTTKQLVIRCQVLLSTKKWIVLFIIIVAMIVTEYKLL